MIKRIKADIKAYGVAVLFGLLFCAVANIIFGAFCPMVLITGLPCPGCGMTRSFLCFLMGEWALSYSMQPMMGLWMLLGIYSVVCRYVLGKKVYGFYWIVSILLLALVVQYIYRLYFAFPGKIPMTYYSNNLLSYVIPNYTILLEKIFGPLIGSL